MQFWVGQLKEIRTLSGSDRIQGNKTRTYESTTVRIQSRSAALFSTEHCQVSGRIQIRGTVFKPSTIKSTGRALSVRGRLAVLASQQARKALRLLT